MSKKRIGVVICISMIFISGILSAKTYQYDELNQMHVQSDTFGLFKNNWVTTELLGVDEDGNLNGVTTLYNDTHVSFNVATNIYVMDNDSPEKPIKIFNVKKDASINGVEKISNLTWKSEKVKHVRPKGGKWWQREKQTGIVSYKWSVNLVDLYATDNDYYIDIKNEKGVSVAASIAQAYLQMTEKVYILTDAIIKGEPTEEINGKIDILVDFAADNFYVKYVTTENSYACKEILKNSFSLAVNNIIPIVKDNKEDVVNCGITIWQIITSDSINLENADRMIDTLREVVMSPVNAGQTSVILEKTANILNAVNSLKSVKNHNVIRSYVDIMNITADRINNSLMSEANADVLFNGIKGIIRLTVNNSNPKETVTFIHNWYNNNFSKLILNSNVIKSEEKKQAINTIFVNSFDIAMRDDYRYFDEMSIMLQEIMEIITDEENSTVNIFNFILVHKDLFISNKNQILNVFEAAAVFVPEEQRDVINMIITIIKNLDHFI